MYFLIAGFAIPMAIASYFLVIDTTPKVVLKNASPESGIVMPLNVDNNVSSSSNRPVILPRPQLSSKRDDF